MPELSVPIWLADFGFLVNITRLLNALNTSLHGEICSGKPTVFAHQSLLDQAATFPKAPVTNAVQYHTFPIAAGNNDQSSREQYQSVNEEVCSRHLISG